MKDTYAIERYEQAAALLPVKYQRLAQKLPDKRKSLAEEFRLRAGQPMTVVSPEGETVLGEKEPVSSQDLEQLCDRVTEYSRYAAAETIARGFITARGGFRIGLCGTVVVQESGQRNLRNLSSVNIRIGREVRGISEELLPQLLDGGQFCSTVIIAPPGAGKTTLLRDMVRALSDGCEERRPLRVALVDERGEIAAMHRGAAQFSVGSHTDVLDGCPKAVGMEMLLRGMNPQIIAVDEITAREDLQLLQQASHSGVALLATLHGTDVAEVEQKPLFRKLLRLGVFQRAVCIVSSGGQRSYQVQPL